MKHKVEIEVSVIYRLIGILKKLRSDYSVYELLKDGILEQITFAERDRRTNIIRADLQRDIEYLTRLTSGLKDEEQ